MDISVFGLGYVGCVTSGCLASHGHRITGVDISEIKVGMIASGRPTIIEKDISKLIEHGVSSGLIKATTNAPEAVMATDVTILCVGTPSDSEGHLDLSGIWQSAAEIGAAISRKDGFHTVLIRSTVPPGTNAETLKIIEQASGKKGNVDFAVVSNPEFLREGSAVSDFMNPPYTVAASDSEKGIDQCRSVYAGLRAPFEVVSIGTAEMIKYINNSFHALKITFANEVGELCKSMGIDSRELMGLFIREAHLNISGAYLRPGFAYGGSCLPKDLKALKMLAHDRYIETPVITSIDRSNQNHIEYTLRRITDRKEKNIGILGLSFKAGTDDLRNSPMVTLAEMLIGKGYAVRIYDSNINLSRLLGANREYLSNHLPHFNSLLSEDMESVIEFAGLIIINHRDDKFIKAVANNPQKEFLDLAGLFKDPQPKNCEGLCW
ncbi:MAG TPA: nucleotide sugar dehydrogenase [Bacteroidales bacterium]|nr:nucleotide sugar dehydrogenase [Bacteroidales bacterium]